MNIYTGTVRKKWKINYHYPNWRLPPEKNRILFEDVFFLFAIFLLLKRSVVLRPKEDGKGPIMEIRVVFTDISNT